MYVMTHFSFLPAIFSCVIARRLFLPCYNFFFLFSFSQTKCFSHNFVQCELRCTHFISSLFFSCFNHNDLRPWRNVATFSGTKINSSVMKNMRTQGEKTRYQESKYFSQKNLRTMTVHTHFMFCVRIGREKLCVMCF